jgi:hypothetical protein
LLVAFVVMFLVNPLVYTSLMFSPPWGPKILSLFGILMFLCGLAAMVVGLISVIRHHERSWLVWLSFLPGLYVLVLLLGLVREFLFLY